MSSEGKAREAVCALGAKLAARGLCPGTSGNISVRIADGWLMTPTNSSLGELDPGQLSKLDVTALRIGPEIDPGVPWTASVGSKPLLLALKSGNFGAPDFFTKAFDKL